MVELMGFIEDEAVPALLFAATELFLPTWGLGESVITIPLLRGVCRSRVLPRPTYGEGFFSEERVPG